MSRPGDVPRLGVGMALRVLAAGVIVVAIVGSLVAWTIRHEAEEIVETFAPETPESRETEGVLSDVKRGEPQTVLLIGDDRRKDGVGGARSDTMILVRLDPDAKVTSTLALPRDLRVDGAETGEKLNAAYAGGRPAPLMRRLKRLLSTPGEPFEIHHYAAIRFTAFSKAVNEFGCFYADVDRRYFNDNSGPGPRYAPIDVSAGYQRLCGEDSLDYVRSRHDDNDLVREARQSHFLAEARSQIATSSLLSRRRELTTAIFRFVGTDIRTPEGLLGVVRLGLDVIGNPTSRVHLETREDGADLRTTLPDLAAAARAFLRPRAAPGGARAVGPTGTTGVRPTDDQTRRPPRRIRTRKVATMRTDPAAARAAVREAGLARDFRAPIYAPRLVESEALYRPEHSRSYVLPARDGRTFPWEAYRLVVHLAGGRDGAGQYYGVQGTTWKDPPVLDLATDEVRLGDRTFLVEYDGRRIRRLVWRAPGGTYWVNNSLRNGLSNAEMRAVARSLVRVG